MRTRISINSSSLNSSNSSITSYGSLDSHQQPQRMGDSSMENIRSAASRRVREERRRLRNSNNSSMRDSITIVTSSTTTTPTLEDVVSSMDASSSTQPSRRERSSRTNGKHVRANQVPTSSDSRRRHRNRYRHRRQSDNSSSGKTQEDVIRILQFDVSCKSCLSYVHANNVHDNDTLSLLVKNQDLAFEEEEQDITESSSSRDDDKVSLRDSATSHTTTTESASSSNEATPTTTSIGYEDQQRATNLGHRTKEKIRAGFQRLAAAPMMMRRRAIVNLEIPHFHATAVSR